MASTDESIEEELRPRAANDKSSAESSDSDVEAVQCKRGRKGKGKMYVPHHEFATLPEALVTLKGEFLGTKWNKLNTCNNVVWFQCKGCELRCKLIVPEDAGTSVALHINADFMNENGEHTHENVGSIVPIGNNLPSSYIARIKELRAQSN